ncbi:hypothetical protein M3Y99_00126700 [Aphelenchoides fujianensis]|nr:hypothetical protein M3Y99_00126700 [Aphelenchoides fujianensis]
MSNPPAPKKKRSGKPRLNAAANKLAGERHESAAVVFYRHYLQINRSYKLRFVAHVFQPMLANTKFIPILRALLAGQTLVFHFGVRGPRRHCWHVEDVISPSIRAATYAALLRMLGVGAAAELFARLRVVDYCAEEAVVKDELVESFVGIPELLIADSPNPLATFTRRLLVRMGPALRRLECSLDHLTADGLEPLTLDEWVNVQQFGNNDVEVINFENILRHSLRRVVTSQFAYRLCPVLYAFADTLRPQTAVQELVLVFNEDSDQKLVRQLLHFMPNLRRLFFLATNPTADEECVCEVLGQMERLAAFAVDKFDQQLERVVFDFRLCYFAESGERTGPLDALRTREVFGEHAADVSEGPLELGHKAEVFLHSSQ